MSAGSAGVAGEGTRPRNVDRDGASAWHPVRVGEHRQLLEVSYLTQIDLLGELTTN